MAPELSTGTRDKEQGTRDKTAKLENKILIREWAKEKVH
jgi:hypothetical protein